MGFVKEQAPPIKNDKPAIWDLVIADMVHRDRVGRERYGTPLQVNNGRDALRDLFEELLDAVVYCRQLTEEMKCLGVDLRNLHALIMEGRFQGREGVTILASMVESILKRNPALNAENE